MKLRDFERVTSIFVTQQIRDASGAASLRIIVRDVRSGSMGSLTVPFSAIPPPPTRQ